MTAVREELHFTGGVRARQAGGGWELGPLLREGGIRTVGGIPDEQIGGLGRAIGLTMFGADRISGFNTPLPTRIWTPDRRVLCMQRAISHRGPHHFPCRNC